MVSRIVRKKVGAQESVCRSFSKKCQSLHLFAKIYGFCLNLENLEKIYGFCLNVENLEKWNFVQNKI